MRFHRKISISIKSAKFKKNWKIGLDLQISTVRTSHYWDDNAGHEIQQAAHGLNSEYKLDLLHFHLNRYCQGKGDYVCCGHILMKRLPEIEN